MKTKLTVATHIARKSSPWVGIATMLIVGITDLKKSR
jgi:hypothetical protein